jgi:four helix bundle protein
MAFNPYPIPSRLWVVSLTEDLTRRAQVWIGTWEKRHQEGVGDQWYRSIDSIGLNLSEGYARAHQKEREHFFDYAVGSVNEVFYCVRRARDRGLITRLQAWQYGELLRKLASGINNLIESEKPRI